MRTNHAFARVLIGGFSAGLLAFACGDDDDNKSGGDLADAASDASTSAGGASGGGAGTGGKAAGGSGTGGSATGGAATDAGDAGMAVLSLCGGKTGQDQIDCGKYIVEHVDACTDCHSPMGPTGPDPTKLLAGNPSFADIDPDPAIGNIPTPNLTQLKADGWTAADIVTAIRDGKDKAGNGLFPIMPYPTFHNMADADAEAIAAYILSLTPITNPIPGRQPLPAPFDSILPVPPYPLTGVPDPVGVPAADQDAAMLGKYLAGQLGVCLECHTPRTPQGAIDSTKPFAGGEAFHLPSPPFPDVIYSLNITPDDTGIAGWTAANVQRTIKEGVDNLGLPLCPPMPFGPMGAFGGMTDEHALAIGQYITHLPPIKNTLPDGGVFPICRPPGPPPDAGTPDASSTPDASGTPDASPADAATGG